MNMLESSSSEFSEEIEIPKSQHAIPENLSKSTDTTTGMIDMKLFKQLASKNCANSFHPCTKSSSILKSAVFPCVGSKKI